MVGAAGGQRRRLRHIGGLGRLPFAVDVFAVAEHALHRDQGLHRAHILPGERGKGGLGSSLAISSKRVRYVPSAAAAASAVMSPCKSSLITSLKIGEASSRSSGSSQFSGHRNTLRLASHTR